MATKRRNDISLEQEEIERQLRGQKAVKIEETNQARKSLEEENKPEDNNVSDQTDETTNGKTEEKGIDKYNSSSDTSSVQSKDDISGTKDDKRSESPITRRR
jgi:hypothetical protein